MKILIVGFQRSGTTLLRRIFNIHPDVRRMFHEDFLIKRLGSRKAIENYLMNYDIDPHKDNWGEKVPFYPSARGMGILRYCRTWKEYFGDDGKIIHIVRHPVDVGNSVSKKYHGAKFKEALKIYRKIMPAVVPKLLSDPSAYTFKYEDLLLNPDEVVPKVYEFCGLDSFDFKKRMAKIPNVKYQKIDPSRAFAYENNPVPKKLRLKYIFNVLNEIPGTEYKL